jgi:type IV pilus assembly protein PilY1
MNRLLSGLAGVALGLAATVAAADDTELFVSQAAAAQSTAKPNILFLYDNSGSMSSLVQTQVPWDPNTTFGGCYNSAELYFSFDGSTPGCGSNNYVDKSVNSCAASANGLNAVGRYDGRLLAWRSSQKKWVDLSTTHNRPVECQADRGLDGQTSASSAKYAANGTNGPWFTDASTEPTWSTSVSLFDGNWLNWSSGGGTVTKTRIQIIQEVTTNLLQTMNNVNVGLEHFNFDEGGTIAHALEDIATARTAMQNQVNALTASTWTPLSESLYEAANYYMGRPVDYGNVGPELSAAASRVGNTLTSNTYLKPVLYACQKNYIVILTDGLPTQDTSATSKIKALPSWASNVTNPNCTMTGDGACMIDLAEYLYRHDIDATMPGLQNVTTYTVGFGTDLSTGDTTFLQATAAKGGGKYYLATDTSTLTSALTKIVTDILKDSRTYTTPTAPVNAFNRTQNLDDVFVSVFAPTGSMHWPGNLKKYRLQAGVLVGQDGNPAVDPATGFFAGNSFSFWSPAPDGSVAGAGGAASQLPVYTARNLYTNLSGTHLNAAGNRVQTANAAVTPALVGAPDATTRDSVVNWANGLDLQDENDNGLTNDIRHVMGDPLHVRPVTIIYGGTAASPDAVVYVSTNDGYLHAVNASTGQELWSFVPTRLMSRLYGLYLDNPTTARSYGLDGDIRAYVMNDDGVPGISGSERVLLLFGMRRGGDSVYAIDVTDRNDPQLLWEVNSTTAGFNNLGQTWSTPVVTKVNVNGTVRLVAIFGGGYDNGEDNPGYRVDTVGRSVYMVDALTGALIWSAGSTAGYNLVLPLMTHSIPAALRVLDMDGDGLADRMYVGDMGGVVWRFDIVNGQPAPTLVTGGPLATLGAATLASPALADVRRFYATPDVAEVISNNKLWLTVNLGSGFREHPLDTSTYDEFYSIRDFHVFDQLTNSSYATPVVRNDLVDITTVLTPTLATTAKGWRLAMVQSVGEKVVSESRTFNNTVFFDSFTPGNAGNVCTASGGSNRFYEVSVLDGRPVTNLDTAPDPNNPNNNLTLTDRFRSLKQGGLAPEPVFLFPQDQPDHPVACIGVECFPPGFSNVPKRTLWSQTGTE